MSDLDPIRAYSNCEPVTGREPVHHPYSAYNQGYDACCAGHGIHANPYPAAPISPVLWRWWRDGWLAAHDDRLEERT